MQIWFFKTTMLGRSKGDIKYNSMRKIIVSVIILYFNVTDDIIRKKLKNKSISETHQDCKLM